MSFSEIDKEWRRYQYLLAHKTKLQAPASVKGYVAVAAKLELTGGSHLRLQRGL